MPQKLRWNHNTHFHRYLLRQFPQNVERALDVGCGFGLFAQKLAQRADTVDALDIDRSAIERASQRKGESNIRYLHADFIEADLPEASYDVIVSIASIHHMNLAAALEKMRSLLRPSGTLIVLGLYRERTITDYLYSVVSIPINHVFLAWHRPSMQALVTAAPTRPAQLSLKEIATVAGTLTPMYSLRRHLFWRYSLIWHKR